MSDLDNDLVALVTGATRGIGKAIAADLADLGITVVGTATTEAGKLAITNDLKILGNNQSFGIVLNTLDPAGMLTGLAELVKHTQRSPLILINNAGITRDNLFLRMTEQEWEQVINADLSGVFHLTKACIKPMLKARWGRIINISSVVAFSGNAGQVNYAAAKAGMIGFSKSLAQEVASRGITVNTIAPGFIETDMTNALPAQVKEQLLAKIPMGRLGTGNEVAKAVRFLISKDASYITGNTLHINGGMLMC